MTEEQRNEWSGGCDGSRFAFPENSVGIGYYVEGEQVSPEEFERLVARDADRCSETVEEDV